MRTDTKIDSLRGIFLGSACQHPAIGIRTVAARPQSQGLFDLF
jgi:hypothetical protein